MRFKRMFTSIDTHTVGEPTRTITGGIPYIPGDTMSEKMLYMKDKQDWIRKILMFEPRGNEVMSGVILTEPCDKRADIGVIYIEVGGYLPMCGHDTIGVATALIESGIIEAVEPVTKIKLDTPAGLVEVSVNVKDNVARDVSFKNVPAYIFGQDIEIITEDFGKIKVDIAYGGNPYIILPADDLGLELVPENGSEIVKIGNKIKAEVNARVDFYHPEKSYINEITHVMFTGKPNLKDSDTKNAVVLPPGAIDRSPCGTGTSARLANLYYRNKIKKGETLVFESIIDTVFKGKVLEETKVGEFKAVIPEITGRAYVTGLNQWVIDPEDPIREGFLLG
jgi:proline racemase